jgi:mono/diheme cytochrome c family protein
MKRLLAALGIFAGAGLVMWLVMGGPGTQVDYRDEALIASGETLFAQNCAACHGDKAAGENSRFLKGGEKPGGSYWAPALNGSAHTWHHPPDALFRIIKDGSPASNSPMRGWGDRLKDPDIHSLLAYLQSLWPDPLRRRYEQALMSK